MEIEKVVSAPCLGEEELSEKCFDSVSQCHGGEMEIEKVVSARAYVRRNCQKSALTTCLSASGVEWKLREW